MWEQNGANFEAVVTSYKKNMPDYWVFQWITRAKRLLFSDNSRNLSIVELAIINKYVIIVFNNGRKLEMRIKQRAALKRRNNHIYSGILLTGCNLQGAKEVHCACRIITIHDVLSHAFTVKDYLRKIIFWKFCNIDKLKFTTWMLRRTPRAEGCIPLI